MKLNNPAGLLSGIVLFVLTIFAVPDCMGQQRKIYEPTIESLDSHPTPQWFRDARFGIFIHWGPYAVPAFHEWYLEFMSPNSTWGKTPAGPPYTAAQGNLTDSAFQWETRGVRGEANRYHREKYGVDFEYDQFIPMFKADKYDPAAWADLFVQSGAKYVVITAKHGDEFAMWPSKYTSRNSVEMGPHRDLTGDLLKEVRARGLKMGLYHNTTYSFWDHRYPNQEWVEYMNNSIKELVDLYQPDILWGDVMVSPIAGIDRKPLNADYWKSKEMIAYFYNHSENPDEVLTNDRWGLDTASSGARLNRSFLSSLSAQYAKAWNAGNDAFLGDFQTPERRNINKICDMAWETCDALDRSSWGYNQRTPDDKYMTVNELVDFLSDIVSKGGNLLINIGPKADGTIPEIMQDHLRKTGAWLAMNGEAIYGTRTWSVYGEGPTTEEVGAWSSQDGGYQFKPGDVRFTRKGNVLYAILLEWPGKEITLHSLSNLNIKKISLLGSDEKIHWKQTAGGLSISLPANPVSPYANTLKIIQR